MNKNTLVNSLALATLLAAGLTIGSALAQDGQPAPQNDKPTEVAQATTPESNAKTAPVKVEGSAAPTAPDASAPASAPTTPAASPSPAPAPAGDKKEEKKDEKKESATDGHK